MSPRRTSLSRLSARRGPSTGLPPEVSALVGVAFLVAVGFGVVAPAIPLFAREFGVSSAAAGAVVSVFAAARLVTAPFTGPLVNAFGERTILATGIAVVAVSSALAGLSQNYWQLLALRGAGGVGSIMFTVSSLSLLIRVTPTHQRGRAQGLYSGGFLAGSIAGPALGVVATWSLRAPFFLYAGTLAAAGSLGLWALRDSELAGTTAVRDSPMSLRAAAALPAYRSALATAFASQWAVIGVRVALVPLFVSDVLHRGSGWTYAAFFVVSIVSGALLLPLGRLADFRGRRPVLIIGLVTGAVALAGLPILPGIPTLLACMAVLGIAGAALSVAPGAVVGDIVGGRGGTVVAAYQMAGDLGSVTGPVVAGWLADSSGYGTSFTVAALVALLPIPLVLRAPETRAARPLTAPSSDVTQA